MIIHDVPQNSYDWTMLRLGIPTASCFDKIVTPTGKLSSQSKDLACKLIAEELMQRQMDDIGGLHWVERGKELEESALAMYEFEVELETKKVGFVTNDDGTIGCSPDRLVGEEGLLELKCPKPNTHLSYFFYGFGNDYKPQVQGQMMLTGRKWCDLYSFHPDFPPVRFRFERDEEFIAILEKSLNEFVAMKNEMMEKITKSGAFKMREELVSKAELAAADKLAEYFMAG